MGEEEGVGGVARLHGHGWRQREAKGSGGRRIGGAKWMRGWLVRRRRWSEMLYIRARLDREATTAAATTTMTRARVGGEGGHGAEGVGSGDKSGSSPACGATGGKATAVGPSVHGAAATFLFVCRQGVRNV